MIPDRRFRQACIRLIAPIDTTDGVLMLGAYERAVVKPIRNVTITRCRR